MKGKMFITGVAALSAFALFGCQQQAAVKTQPETKTSSATLEILPPTQQTSTSLQITGTQEGGVSLEGDMIETKATTSTMVEGNTKDALGVFMKDGKMMTMSNGGVMGEMSADMTLADGTKVMMDGKVMMTDGNTMMMKEGDAMLMTGEKSSTAEMTKMSNKSGTMMETKTSTNTNY